MDVKLDRVFSEQVVKFLKSGKTMSQMIFLNLGVVIDGYPQRFLMVNEIIIPG